MVSGLKLHLKYVFFALFSVALVGVIVFIVFFRDGNKSPNAQVDPLSTQLAKSCEVLSAEVAKNLLSSEVVKVDDQESGQAVGEEIASSQCIYIRKSDESKSPEQQQIVNLRIRSARTAAGEAANISVFENTSMGQPVEGIGQKAYWNSEFGQLNVLSGKDWYIIEYGPGVPSLRKLDDTKIVASKLKF